jgi:transmembrane sensor
MNASDRVVTQVIAEQAQAWFIANREHGVSTAQQREFLAWLQASPAHVREYLAFAKLEVDLHAVMHSIDIPVAELIAAARSEPDDNIVAFAGRASAQDSCTDAESRPRAAAYKKRQVTMLAAAVGTLAVAVLSWWTVTQPPLHKEYITARGEQRTVRLEDGSVLYINSDSSVRVDYTKSERGIVVEHGQALFRVANDKTRPFRVRAGTTEVVAVGTEFDVRCLSDEVLVTVVEGSVAIAKIVGSGLYAADAARAVGQLRLAAGQQARVAKRSLPTADKAVDVRAVDVRPAVAWVQQRIMFEHEALRDVAAEFNRYGTTQLTIDDAQIARLRISGSFNAYDLDSFVLYLGSLKGVEVHHDMDRIRISRARSSVGETM